MYILYIKRLCTNLSTMLQVRLVCRRLKSRINGFIGSIKGLSAAGHTLKRTGGDNNISTLTKYCCGLVTLNLVDYGLNNN